MRRKFTLQSVLEHRHNRVERLEVELGHLRLARNQAQAFRSSLEVGRLNLSAQLRSLLQGALDLETIDQLHAGIDNINRQLDEQVLILEHLACEIEDKRLEVVAAKQEEEALQVLRQKFDHRIQAEQALQETRLRDDIYNAQAYRRAQEARVG